MLAISLVAVLSQEVYQTQCLDNQCTGVCHTYAIAPDTCQITEDQDFAYQEVKCVTDVEYPYLSVTTFSDSACEHAKNYSNQSLSNCTADIAPDKWFYWTCEGVPNPIHQIHTCRNVMYVWLPLSGLILLIAGWKITTTFVQSNPPINRYQKTVMALCFIELVGLLLSNIDEARNGGTCEGWLSIGVVWFSIAVAQCCAIVVYMSWLEYTVFWTYDIVGRYPPKVVPMLNRIFTIAFIVLRFLTPILGGIHNDEKYEWLCVAALIVALVNGLSMFTFTVWNYMTKLSNVENNVFLEKLKKRVSPKLFYGVIVWIAIFLYTIFYTTGGDFNGPYIMEFEGENILGMTFESDNQMYDTTVDTLALIANFLMLSACVWTFFPEYYHPNEASRDLRNNGSKDLLLESFASTQLSNFSRKMYHSQKKYAGIFNMSSWGAGDLREAYEKFQDAAKNSPRAVPHQSESPV